MPMGCQQFVFWIGEGDRKKKTKSLARESLLKGRDQFNQGILKGEVSLYH
jgi:hypothetical protein